MFFLWLVMKNIWVDFFGEMIYIVFFIFFEFVIVLKEI